MLPVRCKDEGAPITAEHGEPIEIGALVTRLHEARGITILLSTHDLRFAATVCTRLVLLSGGRVLADGPPSDVLTPERVGALFDVDPALTIPLLAAAGR